MGINDNNDINSCSNNMVYGQGDSKYNDIHYYFTSEDILGVIEAYKNGNKTIQSIVQYFNARYECNKIFGMIKTSIDEGIKIEPEISFKPITEKLTVTNGKFTTTNVPYNMGDGYFINNLGVMRNSDGHYDLYDIRDFNPITLLGSLEDETKNGIITVTYFINHTTTSTPLNS